MDIFEQLKELVDSTQFVNIHLTNGEEISNRMGGDPFKSVDKDIDGFIRIKKGESTHIFRPELIQSIFIGEGLFGRN